MRRTRHVVLPVKSWQYVGLMVVSLACLTLGLVSRDREGRSGSLAGPELKHTAPHEVDACPNGSCDIRSFVADDSGSDREIFGSRSAEHRVGELSRSRSLDRQKNRSLDRRSLERKSRRVGRTLENRRLTRSSEDLRTRSRERSVRRGQDVSRLRDRVEGSTRRVRDRVDIRRDARSLDPSPKRERHTDRVRTERMPLDRRSLERRERSTERTIRTQNRVSNENRRTRDDRHERRARSDYGPRSREFSPVDRSSRVSSESRIPKAPDTRDVSRDRRILNDGRQSRLENRMKQQTGGRINYLLPLPKYSDIKAPGNENFEPLRQIFILILCTIYTGSIFQGKSAYFRISWVFERNENKNSFHGVGVTSYNMDDFAYYRILKPTNQITGKVNTIFRYISRYFSHVFFYNRNK